MTLAQKARKLWHDLYYNKASAEKIEFAMRCRDVAHHIDFHAEDISMKDRFRLRLHLSLCQACYNYYAFSKFISTKMKTLTEKQITEEKLNQLNEKLVKIYHVKTK